MRRKDREITSMDIILAIIGKAKFLHLGLLDGDYPYVVPLHFGFEYEGGKLFFFVHCAKEGHKLDLIRNNPNVCIELDCDVKSISGGDVPCKYGASYGSVIGRGKAEILTDEKQRIKGLELLMKNQTGHSFNIDGTMTSSVEVIMITVSDFTAKSRQK